MTTPAHVCAEATKAQTRLAGVLNRTPSIVMDVPGVGEVVGKDETQHNVNSYKVRGAYNLIQELFARGEANTVVTASAGNHAQGVAFAVRQLGMKARIYMPVSAPDMKKEAVKFHGGDSVEIVLVGDNYNEAVKAAEADAVRSNAPYIPAFDNLHTIAGQATMALEVVEDNKGKAPFDVVFLQIGGGGMAAGVSSVLQQAYPHALIIGVEGEDQACMKAAFDAGDLVTLPQVDGYCDGTAVTRAGEVTFEVCQQTLNGGVMTVSNDDVRAAIDLIWRKTHRLVEPSGAMGVAGLMKWARENPETAKTARVLTVLSGANMDLRKLKPMFEDAAGSKPELRHLRLEINERNGSLLQLVETCFVDVNIQGFQYAKIDNDRAWPVVTFEADNAKMAQIAKCLRSSKVKFRDVTGAQDVNYSVLPYNPALWRNPLLLTVAFPERKGALREFMRTVQPHANVCYFKYAYSGGESSTALMGFELKPHHSQAKFLEAIKAAPVSVQRVANDTRRNMLYRSLTA